MTRASSWTLRIAGVVIVVGGLGWALRPKAIPVETRVVTRSSLDATVNAEGKTRVRDLFIVTAPVDGELARIKLKAGDAVPASALVASISPAAPRPLDVRSRAEAVAALAAARAALSRATSAQKEAEGALVHAESTRDTARALAQSGAGTANDLEHAEHEVEIRRQALQASRAALAAGEADVARAEAAIAPSLPTTGRVVTEVRAPAAGRILRVLHESAGPIGAGTPLVELGNTTAIEIAADFLTTDATAIETGARALILDWGGPRPLAARVRHVDPGAFTKVSALGLEEQRVTVVLDLAEPAPPNLGNDFHVTASVVVWSSPNVLTIPSTALFRSGGAWAVFMVDQGRARLVPVTPGRSDATRTAIERGLIEGQEVIVQPSDAVRDGVRVVRKQPPPPEQR